MQKETKNTLKTNTKTKYNNRKITKNTLLTKYAGNDQKINNG